MIIIINIAIILEKNNKPYSWVWLEGGANNAKVLGWIPTVAIFDFCYSCWNIAEKWTADIFNNNYKYNNIGIILLKIIKYIFIW